MDLFKLIIFSTSLSLFSSSTLFDMMLIYLFLTITYKTNIYYNNNSDLVGVLVNTINIMMHLMVYQFNNFVNVINKTKYGSLAISSYNYLDSKVVKIKTIIFNWLVLVPVKFVIEKTMGTLDEDMNKEIREMKLTNINQELIIKKTVVGSEGKLETNADISNFLDKLLDENKKTN
jgi:hypothetical protein